MQTPRSIRCLATLSLTALGRMLRAGLDTGWMRKLGKSQSRIGTVLPCVSFHAAAALACTMLVAACSSPPVVTAVDLLCTETTRYHTSDAQVAAAKADPGTWFELFRWLASFDAVRDKRCS